jgi:hypothetical protein
MCAHFTRKRAFAARRARGASIGRPKKLIPQQCEEALQRLGSGETQANVARSYGLSQATADLASVWEERGVSVLQRLAIADPGKLAQIAYGLLPRDDFISVEQRTPGNLDPDEWAILRRVIDDPGERQGRRVGPRAGDHRERAEGRSSQDDRGWVSGAAEVDPTATPAGRAGAGNCKCRPT